MLLPITPQFNLGFGYKYQYFLTALIYTLMTKTIDYSKTKKYMNRQISRYGISNNSTTQTAS